MLDSNLIVGIEFLLVIASKIPQILAAIIYCTQHCAKYIKPFDLQRLVVLHRKYLLLLVQGKLCLSQHIRQFSESSFRSHV